MEINFGKYSGQTIEQIAKNDYPYAVWAAANITNTEVKAAFVAEIKKPEYRQEAIKPFAAAVEKYKKNMRGAFCPADFQKSQGDSIFEALGLEVEARYYTAMFDLISDWVVAQIVELNEANKVPLTNFAAYAERVNREGISAIISRLPKANRAKITQWVIYADEIGWASAKAGGLAQFEGDKFKSWQAVYNAMPA